MTGIQVTDPEALRALCELVLEGWPEYGGSEDSPTGEFALVHYRGAWYVVEEKDGVPSAFGYRGETEARHRFEDLLAEHEQWLEDSEE